MKWKQWPWVPFALLAVLTGLYPLSYYLIDMRQHGVLQNKGKELLDNHFYILSFFIHISFGGLALLIGWVQFSERVRLRRMRLHRLIGKVYVLAVLFSSLAGLIIAVFADGGIMAKLGFGCLAAVWGVTDVRAYLAIRRLDIPAHRKWMIRNYCLTFAAVTLRIYLPLSMLFHTDFLSAYRIISWACWVPNLIVAEWLIRRSVTERVKTPMSLS